MPIRNIIIFILGSVVNKGINFFILPILTYYLTKEDFGVLGLISSVLSISLVFVGLFPTNFLIVKYSKYGKKEISKYIFNIFIITFFTFFILVLVLFIFKDMIFTDIKNIQNIYLITFISLLALFQVLWRVFLVIIQLQQNALKYTIFQFFQVILSVNITLLLVVKFKSGWEGKFFAEFFAYFIASFLALTYLLKNNYITYDLDISKIKELVKFLFPLTFYVSGLFIMGTVDKVFIANMLNLKILGIYSIAMTFAIILNIVFDSANNAIAPKVFELLNKKDEKSKKEVVRMIYLFSIFVIISTIIYIFVSPFIFHIMIDKKFDEALTLLPILTIAYGFEGLRKPISELLNHKNKVKIVGSVTASSAILNIALNYFLIKSFGIYGAIYATLISFIYLYFTLIFFVVKYCQLPWGNR